MENNKFAFLSYSRSDYELVDKIVKFLEQHGVNIYIDKRDIPPGSDYASCIINAIEKSVCCILVFSDGANKSQYVFREMNSAVNHNKRIIPIRLDDVIPSKSLEFYIGTCHWIDYKDIYSLNKLIKEYNTIINFEENENNYKSATQTYKVLGPAVLRSEQLSKIGYTVEKKVIETIEIDYKTLGDSPIEYEINEETEGTLSDWFDYANDFPETSSMLIVNDRIVGYYQFEFLNEENYNNVVSAKQMVTSDMEEIYGFGGDFYCYIAIMPIIREYETQKNYLMLMDDFLKKMVQLSDEGINVIKYAISVYTPLLKKMMSALGFKKVGKNIVGGEIMELTCDDIIKSAALKKKYPNFYKLYGDKND